MKDRVEFREGRIVLCRYVGAPQNWMEVAEVDMGATDGSLKADFEVLKLTLDCVLSFHEDPVLELYRTPQGKLLNREEAYRLARKTLNAMEHLR